MGQTDASVRFIARGSDYTVYLTDLGAVLALRGAQPVRLQPVCAKTPASIQGVEPTGGISNYFKGSDPSHWTTRVPNYRRVHYTSACPGIDVTYYGNPQKLEYDFELAPWVDSNVVKIEYQGAESLRLSANGDLLLKTAAGDLVQPRPIVYQMISGRRVAVDARYRLAGDHSVKFALAGYRRDLPLVIDPVLTYSTFLGGSSGDSAAGITVDSSGNAYVTGQTLSTDFPTTGPEQATNAGSYDAFVTKISADGQTRLYSTYLGGAGSDFGTAIAVDSSGNAYVTGSTSSAAFPLVNAYQATFQGSFDAFVAKLNPSGSSLLYSTYLGGGGTDQPTGIAVDSTGSAYVAGWTNSSNFPSSAGAYQTTNRGIENAFITKFNAGGNSVAYSTLLGGSSVDLATGIVVDSSGNAFVCGISNSTNFPVTAGVLQSANAGHSDAFVTKINASGNGLVYSTLLGGASDDSTAGIRIDGTGNAYVVGTTTSTNFPVLSAAQSTYGGGNSDAFVAKINPSATALLFSTFVGGSGADTPTGIAIDSSGASYITGQTASANFPSVGALYTTGGVFVTAISPAGSSLVYSTHLNGDASDSGSGIAVSSSGAVYVAGRTISSSFPTKNALQPTKPANANSIGFVTVIGAVSSQPPTVVSVSPSSGSGLAQTFTITVSDAAGGGAIQDIYGIINSTFSFGAGCFFQYYAPGNTIYLANDNDSAWQGSTVVGSGGSVSNSQCTISGSGASVSISGSQRMLTFPITFASTFAGAKNFYVYTDDTGSLNSGWQTAGTWTVPGSGGPPTITSVTPSSGSGTTQTFSFTVSDPAGGSSVRDIYGMINSSFSYASGCFFQYYAAGNAIYLANDQDSAWQGSVVLGSGTTVSNSQCTISGTGASVSISGTQIVLNVPITFKPAFAGTKNVYVYADDAAALNSGWQPKGTWTVPGSSTPPSVVSVTPSSGSGATQTFSFTVNDAAGGAAVRDIYVIINNAFGFASDCFFQYYVAGNTLFLANDQDSAWQGSSAVGSGGTVANSQCTISGTGASVSISGNQMTLTVPMTFKAGFAGAKNVYVWVDDVANLNSGWQLAGTWTVPGGGTPPSVVSVSPSSGIGSSQTFSFTVSDAAGGGAIQDVFVIISNPFAYGSSCFFQYYRAGNTLLLANDLDSSWQGSTVVGSGGTVSNSQCTLNGTGASATVSGNQLTLTVPISFKPAYAGAKNVYVYTDDNASLNSGWQLMGTWTAQ